MKNSMDLGPVPADETCVSVGEDNYRDRAMRECRAYIEAIKKVCGEPPDGASLRVKSNPHDYGAYLSVVVEFDGSDEAAVKYAFHVEGNSPTTWEGAGMAAPSLLKRGRSR